MTRPAFLALEDGTVFEGIAVGADGSSIGEVVFNTAMTGYQEILTDPSYARQLVTLTYPHIGNTGCNSQDDEAQQVWAAGLIVRDVPRRPSSWRSQTPLPEWLAARGVVAIADIDTRRLTRLLRDRGAQNACLVAGDALDVEQAIEAARKFPGLDGMDLAREVSTRETYTWLDGSLDLDSNTFARADTSASGKSDSIRHDSIKLDSTKPDSAKLLHVVAYDYGVKRNILRLLADRGCRITVVPAQMPAAQALAFKPDGIFLSNGPGDPAACDYAITATRTFLDARIPLFGICLGHQLMGLALGAKTLKMKFGHHGANHPVKDLDDGRVMITSQNHGFTVDPATLPANARITHVSLFDGSLQGFALTDRPAFCFQGHPEAAPGPHDIGGLFDRFVAMMGAR